MRNRSFFKLSLLLALTLLQLLIIISNGVAAATTSDSPIKHFIVLLEENRSFDHMLGHLKKTNKNVNGLNGDETNPMNPAQPNSPKVKVTFDAEPLIGIDPSHSLNGTCTEIWGGNKQIIPAPMNGFVLKNGPKDMRVYNASTVPVISTLASEFAVIDAYYADVPGPTEPNRLYAHSGTSYGRIINPDAITFIGKYAPQRTIFNDLEDAGVSWKIYYSDFPVSLELDQLRKFPTHIRTLIDFLEDARTGKLPSYSFIEPRWFDFLEWKRNDEHPPYSTTYGEMLIKEVYEALRHGPAWNETVFMVAYDEHGGLYDHVPTPQKDVPNPDGKKASDGFNFERLGLRVPAVLVSPWINQSFVIHEAPKNRYSHSSILSSIRHFFNLPQPPLTKRSAWAYPFDSFFVQRSSPRTDCPEVLPIPPQNSELWLQYIKAEYKPSSWENIEGILKNFDAEIGRNSGDAADLYYNINFQRNTKMDETQTTIAWIAWDLGDHKKPFNPNMSIFEGAIYVRKELEKWLKKF